MNLKRLLAVAASLAVAAIGFAGPVAPADGEGTPPTVTQTATHPPSQVPREAARRRSDAEQARVLRAVADWITAENYRTFMAAAVAHDAEVARQAQEKLDRAYEQRRKPAVPAPQYGSGRCGGSLPPCWVMMRESRGDIHAENPTSTASGKWQIVDGSWGGSGGYSHASQAPEAVQDERARQLWAGGAGCSHWSAC